VISTTNARSRKTPKVSRAWEGTEKRDPSTEKVNYYCLHEKIIVGVVVVIEFLS
jgi:hypothetical protein